MVGRLNRALVVEKLLEHLLTRTLAGDDKQAAVAEAFYQALRDKNKAGRSNRPTGRDAERPATEPGPGTADAG